MVSQSRHKYNPTESMKVTDRYCSESKIAAVRIKEKGKRSRSIARFINNNITRTESQTLNNRASYSSQVVNPSSQ